MGISLNPEHLKRYRDLARIFLKYGRSDLVRSAGLEEALEGAGPGVPSGDGSGSSRAEELAGDLEKLGPTFVKLGQLLSTRADLLPLPYMEALARLQDKVEPFPFEDVERIVSTELGVRISKGFSRFDPVPLGSASLGQVHRAALRDGREVAVKVQRPEIRERMVEDLDALHEVARFMDRGTQLGRKLELDRMLDEFRKTLLAELDYRQEARNLDVLAQNLKDFPRIVIPLPVEDYTSTRVLTMDFVRGRKITSLGPLARMEMEGEALGEELFRAYLQQILVDGFFHADPHPGNVFLTDDGRLALLDLGMVARITPGMQESLLKLLMAISEGRSDEAADLALRIGDAREGFDERAFRAQVADIVGRQQGATVQELEVGKTVLQVTRTAGDNGVRVPRELTMLGKALLNLDQVGRALDPHFDPNASVRRNAAEIMRRRMGKAASPGNVFATLLEMNEFVQTLPGRVNRILDMVATNQLQVRVDAIDEGLLIEGFQKVANRITLGLVLAALIVGAAMLMRVETSFRILGYPGLAILCFLAAAAGGFGLVLSILLHDRKANPRRPPA
ncbi:MAG: AarF/ABC1/UbiB kinase family protein [Gemmatimonadetes bacterium]|nr:AarF/ABC1/UbiB kinase family protein [Gemmatimonadota bacterium]